MKPKKKHLNRHYWPCGHLYRECSWGKDFFVIDDGMPEGAHTAEDYKYCPECGAKKP